MHPAFKRLVCVLIPSFAFVGFLFGREKINLKRIKPVPNDQPIPAQDFFRPEQISGPRLSPDGKHLAAYVALAGKDHYGLMIDDLSTNKSKAVGGYGDEDIYKFRWLDDRHIMFFLLEDKLYAKGVLVGDIRHLDHSYPLLQWDLVDLVGVPRDHPLQPVIWIRTNVFHDDKQGPPVRLNAGLDGGGMVSENLNSDAYEIARDNYLSHVLKSYPFVPGGMGVDYLCGPSGELAYGISETGGYFNIYRLAGGKWIKSPIDLDKVDLETYGNKPGQLVVVGPRQEGVPRPLEFMDAATGKPGVIILQEKNYDVTGSFFRDPKTNEILGVSYATGGPQMIWFSKEYRGLQRYLNKRFPGLIVRIIDSDRVGRRYLVKTFSDRQPAQYFLVDLKARKIGLIEASRPWINPKRMRPMSILKYKTSDGKFIDAYVTLPAGTSKTHPAPLVVLPHGGPWVRDVWGFDAEAQFLASRGYAVLQPNYRGSPGYDWEFPESDQWAFRKMNDDVTQATKALLSTGYVDPSRVAIMGGSFGGYLAVAGAAFEPKLYRCAITIDGVFDWARLLKDDKYYRFEDNRYAILRRHLGNPEKTAARFSQISPIQHVDQIRIPVFVIHGKDDPVVDVSQSKRLIGELKRFHIPYEEMIAFGEGHGMLHLKHRVEMYNRILVFLNKYIGPGLGQPASAAEK